MTPTLAFALCVIVALMVVGFVLLNRSITTGLNQRIDIENRTATSIQKIESVLTGSFSKGAAGENIVESFLATLPAEWLVRDFTVGNKKVEFGVRLPDNLVLPIDSKVVKTELVQQFISCEDPDQQKKLKNKIHIQTENAATEIQKYLDPNLTTSFGLAVVSDPLYAICAEIIPSLSQQNVILVSYTLLIPYILLIYHMTLKNAQTIDVQRLDAFVNGADQSVQGIRELINGRFSRAGVMLNSFKADIEVELNKLTANLRALKGLDKPADAGNGQDDTSAKGTAV